MIIVSGECPQCSKWVDKVLREVYGLAPIKFLIYCEKCGKEQWIETQQVSESIDGSYFREVPPRFMK